MAFFKALWIIIDNKNDDSDDADNGGEMCVLLAFELGKKKKMSDEKKSECRISVLQFSPNYPLSSSF